MSMSQNHFETALWDKEHLEFPPWNHFEEKKEDREALTVGRINKSEKMIGVVVGTDLAGDMQRALLNTVGQYFASVLHTSYGPHIFLSGYNWSQESWFLRTR